MRILITGAAGQLGETKIEWAKEPSVCVVLASRGYPETPETGGETAEAVLLGRFLEDDGAPI